MGYEIIEHPADIGFRVCCPTLEDAFADAGLALFSIMASGGDGTCSESRRVDLSAEDLCALLYDFLEELLILFETEDFFGFSASVRIRRDTAAVSLSATISGTAMEGPTWCRSHGVKAITYHQMRISEAETGCTIEVIVDV